MITDSQPTHNTTAPPQPPRLQSHRGIAFVQESFPDTFQLFEDLAEGNSSLEQSVNGILVGMRTGGGIEQVINKPNEAGQTLAHLVGLYGPTSLWEELLELGIDYDIVDNTNHTAVDYAFAHKTIKHPQRDPWTTLFYDFGGLPPLEQAKIMAAAGFPDRVPPDLPTNAERVRRGFFPNSLTSY